MTVEVPSVKVIVNADFVMTINGEPAVSAATEPVFDPAARGLMARVLSATPVDSRARKALAMAEREVLGSLASYRRRPKTVGGSSR